MIAIIGAGIQGCAVALELASRGMNVHLFDKASQPMSAASRWNEGKIHLGYVFAKDRSLATAKRMLSGSLIFFDFFNRHLGRDAFSGAQFSSPFLYAVHKDSMLTPEQIGAHLSSVDDLIEAAGGSYFGETRLRRSTEVKANGDFNSEKIRAVFQTPERSLNTHYLADKLVESVLRHPNIAFYGNSDISRIERQRRRNIFSLHLSDGTTLTGYRQLVNTAWQERLRLDSCLGYQADLSWIHRYKLAVHIHDAQSGGVVPSTTFVLGPLGDVVNFGQGRFYLSWYPVCRIGSCTDLLPPEYAVDDATLGDIGMETLTRLCELLPSLGSLTINWSTASIRGGYIFAWGAHDIDHERSGLHFRHTIGVFSDNGYHSIDTGKYGMAARFALETAERICGYSWSQRIESSDKLAATSRKAAVPRRSR